MGHGFLAVVRIGTGIHLQGLAFLQPGGYRTFRFPDGPFHKSDISPRFDGFTPVVLERFFDLLALGIQHNAGGIPVQPVNDEDPVLGMLPFDMLR
ncbi:hypothetical protein D3C73_1526560 [compost metagenome]